MKNLFYCILAIVAGLFISTNVYAQRPVWLLGHRCNSMSMIEYALEDGANGVEIDVTCGGTKTNGSHWNVAHTKFVPKEKCDDRNWMSLETLLQKDIIKNDPRFCLLYIDVKDTKYIKELVGYVHKTYKYKTPGFYILYGLNLDKMADIPIANIKFLTDSLNAHEGFATQSDGDIDGIERILKSVKNPYPIQKYCYINGRCVSFFANSKLGLLERIASKKKNGEVAVRSGFWTCQYATHANRAYQANVFCDLTMVESRGWGATSVFRKALYYTYHEYIKDSAKYGLKLATRDDNFWARYW